MKSVVYLSVSETEERVINIEYVRELWRVGTFIGYTYIDGKTSSCSMETVADAEEAFKQIYEAWES